MVTVCLLMTKRERKREKGAKRFNHVKIFVVLQADNQDSDSISPEITTKSVRLAVEYNSKLAEQRRTTRQMYLDTQTMVHIY